MVLEFAKVECRHIASTHQWHTMDVSKFKARGAELARYGAAKAPFVKVNKNAKSAKSAKSEQLNGLYSMLSIYFHITYHNI